MKCLKSGMNDLAGVRSESVLVHTIAATLTVLVPKMLSHR